MHLLIRLGASRLFCPHLAIRSPAFSSDPSGSTWCSIPAAGDSRGMNIFITWSAHTRG